MILFSFKILFRIVTKSSPTLIFIVIRFQESGESLSRMKSDRDGCDVLVPLTGSMYVPGKLSNPDKVVVDIGTGYYVEKNSKDAQDYFNRKVKYVTENMERVQAIGMEKNKIRFVLGILTMNYVIAQQYYLQRACDGRDAGQAESSVLSSGSIKI